MRATHRRAHFLRVMNEHIHLIEMKAKFKNWKGFQPPMEGLQLEKDETDVNYRLETSVIHMIDRHYHEFLQRSLQLDPMTLKAKVKSLKQSFNALLTQLNLQTEQMSSRQLSSSNVLHFIKS